MMYTPKGFRFAVANAGFRKEPRNDVALLVSDAPAVAVGVFTQNAFPAAPVLVGRERLAQRPQARAVVINSGQSNACTGERGLQDCLTSLALVGTASGIEARDMLPCSTGVIGPYMDMDKWKQVAPVLGANLQKTGAAAAGVEAFARAIMTTDAFPKFVTREIRLSGGAVRLAAMAKGAGMICPNMATMLSVVLCDAAVEASVWQRMFHSAVALTFNRVTVDGDTSTNDTVYGLANGCSGVSVSVDDEPLLQQTLTAVLGEIAYMLVQDGEGGSKVAHIHVHGAASDQDAEQVARTVGHSQLVKTALYGLDANWGRIVAAVGRSNVNFNPMDVRVSMCGVEIFAHGRPAPVDIDAALAAPLKEVDIPIEIILGDGPGDYTLLASDLGHEYVDCNASYRS